MASLIIDRVARPQFTAPPPDPKDEEFAQHKLYRLMELRAVIDAVRCEREARDPLLSWVIDRERPENS